MIAISAYDARETLCPLNGYRCRAGKCLAWAKEAPEDAEACRARFESLVGYPCSDLCDKCGLCPGVCTMIDDQ